MQQKYRKIANLFISGVGVQETIVVQHGQQVTFQSKIYIFFINAHKQIQTVACKQQQRETK